MAIPAQRMSDFILGHTQITTNSTLLLKITEKVRLPRHFIPFRQNKTSLPADSTVKDSKGNEITITDALEWKTENKVELKTEYQDSAVAGINGVGYDSLDAAITAAQNGDTITILKAAEDESGYKLNGSLTYSGKAITIKAASGVDVKFDMSTGVALHGAKITFEGVTFEYKTNNNYVGLQHTDTMVYNNCVFNGQMFLYGAS